MEGTETDFIKHKAGEIIRDPKIGRVVQVYEHVSPDDNSNFECDVVVDGGTFEERAVPYNGLHSAQISPPKVGDKVIVGYLAGDKKRPVVRNTVYTNRDRAPLARAGMYRDEYEAGTSPAGAGNIKVTGYTQYDDNPARVDKNDLTPVHTWFQISKEQDTPNPINPHVAPMSIEMYDSPTTEEDSAHIKLTGNQVDGDDTKSLDVTLNFKSGQITVEADDESAGKTMELKLDVKNHTAEISGDGTNTMGAKFDFDNDTFRLIDGKGYGIVSDGNGDFTWYNKNVTHINGTTTL